MGKSYNTLPPKVKAQKEYDALENKVDFYPKIIERKPYPGDTHLLSKQTIKLLLSRIPKEYVYGLTEIELRAREPNRNKPLGYYDIVDQKIVLYSMGDSMQVNLQKVRDAIKFKAHYEWYKAKVEIGDPTITVTWEDKEWREYWFIKEVFLHEIGHHYSEFYKCRKKAPTTKVHQEYIADFYRDQLVKAHWIDLAPFKVVADMFHPDFKF